MPFIMHALTTDPECAFRRSSITLHHFIPLGNLTQHAWVFFQEQTLPKHLKNTFRFLTQKMNILPAIPRLSSIWRKGTSACLGSALCHMPICDEGPWSLVWHENRKGHAHTRRIRISISLQLQTIMRLYRVCNAILHDQTITTGNVTSISVSPPAFVMSPEETPAAPLSGSCRKVTFKDPLLGLKDVALLIRPTGCIFASSSA